MILSSLLPPWLNPMLLGGIAGAIVLVSGTAYTTHKFDEASKLTAVQTERDRTADLQLRYDGYKQGVTARIAANNATAALEQNRLGGILNGLQSDLAEQQRITNAKSDELKRLLASAKPGDVRPIGPIASSYYDRLRGP